MNTIPIIFSLLLSIFIFSCTKPQNISSKKFEGKWVLDSMYYKNKMLVKFDVDWDTTIYKASNKILLEIDSIGKVFCTSYHYDFVGFVKLNSNDKLHWYLNEEFHDALAPDVEWQPLCINVLLSCSEYKLNNNQLTVNSKNEKAYFTKQ